MIMKTKHVKNTGQMVRRGQIGKLPGGAKGANCEGGGQTGQIAKGGGEQRGQKIAQGGHCPFCLIALVRPLYTVYL